MKYLALLILICFGFIKNECCAQSFINGDFEDNTSLDCDYNLTDDEFNTKISNVFAFGKGYTSLGYIGEVDIQTSGCYLDPQNGNWCLGLSSDTTSTSDAVTIELTTNLIAGNDYKLLFYTYGNTTFQSTLANIEIGETLTDSSFGVFIDSIVPDINVWKQVSLTFTATQNSNHISVRTKIGIRGWTQIDNFSIFPLTTSVNEPNFKNNLIVYPNPADTEVNIDFQEHISSGFVTLSTASGKLLFTDKITDSSNIKFDLTKIPPGVYFVKIESKEMFSVSKFIRK